MKNSFIVIQLNLNTFCAGKAGIRKSVRWISRSDVFKFSLTVARKHKLAHIKFTHEYFRVKFHKNIANDFVLTFRTQTNSQKFLKQQETMSWILMQPFNALMVGNVSIGFYIIDVCSRTWFNSNRVNAAVDINSDHIRCLVIVQHSPF